jgi:signal transduction histidine kinase
VATGALQSVDERMALLVDAVQRLSLARSLQDVQEVVRVCARSLTGADGATFVLREGDQCFYADEDAIAPLWKGQRFPLSACISGWAMLNRQHVVIPDIYEDDRIPHEAYRPTFVRSLVMMPIRTLQPIGAIGNYWADSHLPSDEDITLLRALADSTAVALENISVLEQLDYQVRLLNTLAHEVRNPLLAAQALIGQADQSEDLELASDALTEAMRIVSEQLDVAKMNASEPRVMLEDVELARLLDGLRDSYAPLCHSGVELVADAPAGLTVRTDPRVLSQIVRNLLSNALKFTDRGSVELSAAAHNGRIEVVVADSGLGIAAEDQPRIFEEFQQVDAVQAGRRPGTGLGLPLVRRLARALGGDIELQSQPGEGSRFTVVLPS